MKKKKNKTRSAEKPVNISKLKTSKNLVLNKIYYHYKNEYKYEYMYSFSQTQYAQIAH